MPQVPIAPATRADVLEMAERRWAAVMLARPDLEPAVRLQRSLIADVLELADAIDRCGVPRLSLPPRYLAAKLARGVPALAAEPIPVPAAVLTPFVVRFCGALAEGGAGAAADHVRESIASGAIEPASLFSASLTRDQAAIRSGAVHRGLAPDLVWLVAELAVAPFAYRLQRTLFDNPALADALDAWDRGFCAACGSWPALAEVVGGHRILRCSFCADAWELKTYACIYCEEAGEPFVTAAPAEDRKDRRVEVCRACASYLKTVDLPALSPFPLLAIADLETMDLDVAAMEHGYQRPTMRDFARRSG